MKKLLLTGLAIASLIAVNIQAQPVAPNITINTPEDTPVTRYLTLDIAGGNPPYVFKFQKREKPEGGLFVLPPNGTLEFEPSTNFAGQLQWQYWVTDANGDSSNQATLTINVIREKG